MLLPPLAQVDGVVFPFLGGFGRYQKRLMLLSWLPALIISCNQYSDYIHLAQPNITCSSPNASSSFFGGFRRTLPLPSLNGSAFINDNYEEYEVECSCKERHIHLDSGLKKNVVTQVRMRWEAGRPAGGR